MSLARISPVVIVPSITDDGILGVMETANNMALLEDGSEEALEAFKLMSRDDGGIKFDFLDKLTPSMAYNSLDRVLAELDKTILSYEGRMSAETSKCTSQMFTLSKTAMKLCYADIKKYRTEAARFKKDLSTRGLTEDLRAQYQAAYNEAKDREEDARQRAVSAAKDIPVPTVMMDAIRECDRNAANAFKIVDVCMGRYMKTIDAYYDEVDFRYQIEPADFREELDTLKEDISRGSVKRNINDMELRSVSEMQRNILGQSFDPNACTGSYSLKNSMMLNARYKDFRKVCEKIHKRIAENRKLCKELDGEEPRATFHMILTDTMTLGYLCMLVSQVMNFSLKPHFAILEMASRLDTKKN